MTDTEKYYAQIEKEALALTWAAERFEEYITGIHITLETDHKPLVQILQSKKLDSLTPRLLRFRMRLMRYSYVVTYVPGKSLVIADSLSRAPLQVKPKNEELGIEVQAFVNLVMSSIPIKDEYLQKIRECQSKDPICIKLKQYVYSSWPEKSKISPILYPYFQYRNDFSIIDDLITYCSRIVIPPEIQKEVLEFIHLGHQGIVKCRRRAQSSVWWLGLSSQIDHYVRNCPNCVEERVNSKETFYVEDLPTRPMEKTYADLYKCKNKWYLIFTDYYSRFFEINLLSNMTQETIIDNLKSIFARFGICDILRSDGGPQFRNKFKEFATEYNFIHQTSSPYFPQSNGAIEAAVKIAKALLHRLS